MKTRTLLLGLILTFGGGCEDPAADVTAAEVVGDPSSSETTETPPTETESGLTIDTAASTFEFVGSKVTGSHVGHFGAWSGRIAFDPAQVEASRVTIDVQMATVEADSARLTTHLRTADFFAVDEFPTASFQSTSLEPAPEGSGDATHLVNGTLTLRGHTETIRFPITLETTDAEVRARAEFSIDRQRWGVSFRGAEDNLIRDDVVIRFNVVAPRS